MTPSRPSKFADQIDQLRFFITRVRAVQADRTQSQEDKLNDLKNTYRDLHFIFEKIKKAEIVKNFSEKDAEVIEFLKLGEKNNKVFERLALLVSANPENPALTLAKFIKSREGFDEINVKLSSKNDEHLKEVFETLFGVELAANCVQAFRAEKVGSFIGYALSGLHKEHIEQWKKDRRSVDEKGSLSQYIIAQISRSDGAFEYTKVDKGEEYGYHAQVNPLGVRHSSVRVSETADHCFVNNREKKLVLGFSTSASKTPSQQGQAYFDALEAAKCLVAQEYVNGQPNSYYGYTVEPYYFSTGYMVSNIDRQDLKEGHKESIGQVRGREVINKTLQSSDQELSDYAQSAFLAISLNGGHPKAFVSFFLHNLFLAGTDTEDCYEFSKVLAATNDFDKQSEMTREFVCRKFASTLKVLNKSGLSQEYESAAKTGRESFLLTAQNVLAALKGLPHMSDIPLTQADYNSFVSPFLEQADVFVKKYGTRSQTQNKVVKEMETALSSLDYEDGPQSALKRLNKFISTTTIPSDPKWIAQKNEKVVKYTTAVSPDNLIPLVGLGRELQSYIKGFGFLENKFNRYVNSLSEVLSGEDVDQVLAKNYPQYSSRVSLSVQFNIFKNQLANTGKYALCDFVGVTQFVLSKYFNNGDFGPRMRETSQRACDFYNQSRFNPLRGNIDKAIRLHLEQTHGDGVSVKRKYNSRK